MIDFNEEEGETTPENDYSSSDEYHEGDDVGFKGTKSKNYRSGEKRSKSREQKEKHKKIKLEKLIHEDTFLEELIQNLKTTTEESIVREKLNQEIDILGNAEGSSTQIDLKFKRTLFALNVDYSCTTSFALFEANRENGIELLKQYAHDPSTENLERVLSFYSLNKDTHAYITRALIPPSTRVYKGATELQYTTSHFSPLFDLASISKNHLSINSNKQTPELLNKKILSKKLQSSLSAFQLDGIMVQKYNDKYLLKMVREDKRDRYDNHLDHPDFFKVVFVMRLALSRNVRELVKEKLDPSIHNHLYVIGMTTDCAKANLYSMQCRIDNDKSLSYSLFYLGSFQHSDIEDRAQLVDFLLHSFLVPDAKKVEEYLKHTKPSIKEPSTSKKKVQSKLNVITDVEFCFTEKCNENTCSTTESLWRGILTNTSTNKKWEVFCKKYKEGSNDSLMRSMKFLTLYVGDLPSGEILTLAGEKIKKLGREEMVQLFVDLVIQMVGLFENKVIHNDIKPSNVVKYQDHYFLIDYGLAILYRFYDADHGICYSDADEIIKSKSGTPTYDSPEKNENGIVSPKSDIFALGRTLLELFGDEAEHDMKELISKMLKTELRERMDAHYYFGWLNEKYPDATENAVAFFSDRNRYREEFETTPNNSIFNKRRAMKNDTI
ncbi:hypothetical protein C9374_005630 [Naegleria lovaniensis]|uniref:non-specific serine/threonine protein kinase n=1 Tax=Naegleria lovaniensis TaxID=51637 RepID=A0AA88KK05_NAELO|nr:uncharacterized protein C9374_005630 [Naegleria lovaniensis]KAG2382428.1 hypothetical protein C9374_005630 [Naegleria lovaniensis]